MNTLKTITSNLAVHVMAILLMAIWAPLSTAAEETKEAVLVDAAVAVAKVVAIDKEERSLTLKNDEGEEWTFTAGPEVRNFDQIKRGDLVLASYYNAFALALKPGGSRAKMRVEERKVERAKVGDKPAMRVTRTIEAKGVVEAVDRKQRTVTLTGAKQSLVLKASAEVDLSAIKAGDKVEAVYVASYAIAVESAPKLSGSVKLSIKAVALGVGFSWGSGTLEMNDGSRHDFKVKGLSIVDIGASTVEATGDVYHLVEAKDLAGAYFAGQAGAALVKGGSVQAMKNDMGVVIKLKSSQTGLRLTLAPEGLKISDID